METSNEKKLLSRSEVQQLLKLSATTLTKMTKSGQLTYYKAGRRILFNQDELLNELKIRKG